MNYTHVMKLSVIRAVRDGPDCRARPGRDGKGQEAGQDPSRPCKLNGNLLALKPAIEAGTMSRGEAATQLGVTVSAVSRALRRLGGEVKCEAQQ